MTNKIVSVVSGAVGLLSLAVCIAAVMPEWQKQSDVLLRKRLGLGYMVQSLETRDDVSKANTLYLTLHTTERAELASLSLSTDPCRLMDCMGVPTQDARDLIRLVREERQRPMAMQSAQPETASPNVLIAAASVIISFSSFQVSFFSYRKTHGRKLRRKKGEVAA